MVRKLIKAITLAGVLALAAPLAQAEDLKVGFVNPARVSSEAPQAESARRKLEQEFAPRDEEIVELQQELQKLEDRLNRDSAVMSDSEKRKLEREIVELQREIRRTKDAFREDFNIRRNEELGNLQRRIVETIQAVAEERNFDLVVSDGVIYASERIDITDLIIERLNQQYQSDSSSSGQQ